MSEISSFTSNSVDTVSDAMMNELRKVGEKYGVEFGRKGIRYTPGDFRVTITAKVCNREEGVLTAEEQAYNSNRNRHNLPELGFTFTGSNGFEMTIIGWNTRARKYPVELACSNGKKYKSSVIALVNKTVKFVNR